MGLTAKAVAPTERGRAWSWPLSPNVEVKNTWFKRLFVTISWGFVKHGNTFASYYIENFTYPVKKTRQIKDNLYSQPTYWGWAKLPWCKGRFLIRVRFLTPKNTFISLSRQSRPSDFLSFQKFFSSASREQVTSKSPSLQQASGWQHYERHQAQKLAHLVLAVCSTQHSDGLVPEAYIRYL